MQLAGALDLVEFDFDARDALLDQAAVGFKLRLAGAAEKAEAAALAFEMGPGAHQPALLVGEMGVLDLQRAFARARAPAEDFQDQSGAIDDFRVPGFFQIALLHRRDRAIHHHDRRRQTFGQAGDFVDLAGAEISRGTDVIERDQPGLHHIEIDGAGKPDGFRQTSVRRARVRG